MVDAKRLLIGGQSLTLRDTTPADMPDVLGLHHRVFGTAVDEQWFHWKYNLGCGEGVGAWHDGRLVAHCGGFPRHVWHGHVRKHDLQIGDVMVDPQWRGILTRQGPFFHVSNQLYETRLGREKRFHVGFGFPNARALRLGVRSGLSWDTGQVLALQWEGPSKITQGATAGLSRFFWRVSHLSAQSPAFDAIVDGAWRRMQADAQGLVLPERSAAYVRWRFVQQPGAQTIFLALRRPWQKWPVGVAVLSLGTGPQSRMHWLDWIGPPRWMAQACAMCRAEAAAHADGGLMTWASPAVYAVLAQTGVSSQAETARISVAAASDILKSDAEGLNWWLMGGDTDFL